MADPVKGEVTEPTTTLPHLGQSLRLDNVSLTIFDHAIKNGTADDDDISRWALASKSAENLYFDLALADFWQDLIGNIEAKREAVLEGG